MRNATLDSFLRSFACRVLLSLGCAILAVLYNRRAKYEESILSQDCSYIDYLRQVKYRCVPGVY